MLESWWTLEVTHRAEAMHFAEIRALWGVVGVAMVAEEGPGIFRYPSLQ